MKKLILAALAAASIYIPTVVQAQATPNVKVPMCLIYTSGRQIPCTGIVPIDKDTGNPMSWSETNGLSGLPVSGKTAVSQSLSATGSTASFVPIAGRPFNITISATGTTGLAAQIERSFDNGVTWFVKYPDSLRSSLPETFSDTEAEVGVRYKVTVTAISSGNAVIRISQ